MGLRIETIKSIRFKYMIGKFRCIVSSPDFIVEPYKVTFFIYAGN